MISSLLTFIGVLAPLYLVRFQIGPVPTTLLEVFIYLLAAGWLISRRFKIDLPKKRLPDWLVLGFVGVGLVSALIDPNLANGLGLWKAYFLDAVILYYLVLIILHSGENYHTDYLTRGVLISGGIVGWLAFAGTSTGGATLDGRLLGPYMGSPNYLALYLAPIAVLGVGYFFKAPKNLLLIGWATIALITITALEASGSRGGLLAFYGGITALSWHLLGNYRDYKIARILRIILSAGGIALVAGLLWIARPDVTSHGRAAESSNIRLEIYKTSFEMLRQKPILGVGLSNYQNYFGELTKSRVNYPEYITPQALTAHNLYLHFWLTTGIAGLAGFLAIVYLTIRRFFQLPYNAIRTFWFGALVAILIYGLVDTPYFKNDLAVFFWLVIAVLWV